MLQGTKIKIGLYGGSFSPCHLGHLEVMNLVLKNKLVDYILMVPCYSHMFSKDLIDPHHRLNMCKILCRNKNKISASSYEIDNKLNGSTYTFLEKFSNEPGFKKIFDLYYIIGADNASLFNHWKNYKKLISKYKFIVVERIGVYKVCNTLWFTKKPHTHLKGMIAKSEISSTDLRGLIKAGDPKVKKYLDPKVLEYIKKHNLYVD